MLTITRIGNPGRMVSVGWMLALRFVISCPTWLIESCVPFPNGDHRSVAVLVKGAVGANSEESILNECERGETLR